MRKILTAAVLFATLFAASAATNAQPNETPAAPKASNAINETVLISATCKAESVIDLFPKAEERQIAIDWFKKHGVTRVYLETFRHGRFADEELLRTVKAEFENAGIETFGAICPTDSKIKALTNCSADAAAHELLGEISKRTAAVFERIILDDFIFTHCACDACKAAKGDRSWSEFRREFQLELCRKFILEPARAVDPNVVIYVKYPCWYEGYAGAGYDVLRQTKLFGHSWIGTETREPDDPAGGRTPQTQASWIQGWANDFSDGKCGGAWFDPLGTKPETFVEQARQSILGGAKEILIHCYDYLGTATPGIAVHGDTRVAFGKADAEAFRREKDGLLRLARLLENAEPEGVLAAKRPNFDPPVDARWNSFIGMLGVPVLPAASLKESKADFLSRGSATVDDAVARAISNRKAGRPTLITWNFVRAASPEARAEIGLPADWLDRDRPATFVEKIDETLFVIGNDADRWDLTKLPSADLAAARDALTKPFGLRFDAPTRVSLHLYRVDDGERRIVVVENFNDAEVEIALTDLNGVANFAPILALPTDDKVRVDETKDGAVRATLAPRSLVAFETAR